MMARDEANTTESSDTQPKAGGKRLKTWIFRILAICVSVAFTLLIVEIGLRFAGFTGEKGRRFAEPDAELSWANRPLTDVDVRGLDFQYHVVVNSRGFRGPELNESAQSRIMMIGDSMVFGIGVNDNETFSARLQELLNDAGQNMEVVNAGVFGYGSSQSKKLALRNWEVVKPNIVIFTHVGNDLADDIRFAKGTYQSIRNSLPGRQFLKENSALYNVAKKPALSLLSTIGFYNPAIRFEDNKEGALVSDVGEQLDEAKAIFQENLKDLKRICEERGAQFLVTTVGFWLDNGEFTFSSQSEWVKSICEKENINYINPVTGFPKKADESWTNQNSVGHYSPVGNRFFAKSLFNGLESAGCLKQPE